MHGAWWNPGGRLFQGSGFGVWGWMFTGQGLSRVSGLGSKGLGSRVEGRECLGVLRVVGYGRFGIIMRV